jgi:hypothetical protein
MKYPGYTALACLLAGIPTASFALDIGVGANIRHFDYAEYNPDGGSPDGERGVIPGVTLSLDYQQHHVSGSFTKGKVNYDGQLQFGTPYTTQTREILYAAGYEYTWPTTLNEINAIVGLDLFRWERNVLSNGSVPGVGSVYQWKQLHAGVRYRMVLFDIPVSLDASLLKTFSGTVEVLLGDFGFNSPRLDLGDEYGFQLSLKHNQKLSDDLAMRLYLETSRWKFGRSNSSTISNGLITSSIVEPRSISLHTTAGIEFVYKY